MMGSGRLGVCAVPWLIASGVFAGLACADTAPDESAGGREAPGSRYLDTLVVSATRSERLLVQVPNVASVHDRETLDRRLARDIADLVRYEPGVSVTSSFGRFGLGGFRIRGLDGNRVRIELDGAPVPDAFSIGAFASAGRDVVDLDLLERVEILRGPSSALYGSDALAGVVAMRLRDPEGYLGQGQSVGFGASAGYDSRDTSRYLTGRLAAAAGDWSLLLAINAGRGSEPRNRGDDDSPGATRTAPNPQDTERLGGLARMLFAPGDRQRFRLTLDGNRGRIDTDVQSARVTTSGFGPPVQVLDLQGEDRRDRVRLAFDHEWQLAEGGWLDSLQWQVFTQWAETRQDTFERRAPLLGGAPGPETLRERRFDFEQRSDGLSWQGNRDLRLGETVHALTLGASVTRSRFTQQRDGLATLPDGRQTNVIIPDTFPVRDFPLSRTTEYGVFLQNEVSLNDGRFMLVPGLRYDRFSLSPQGDELFAARNPGIEPTGLRESRVSPRLGAIWRLDERWSLFANYAEGFRSPPYNDVNLGFTNLQFGYTALPNPDLRAETSRGFEAGLRVSGEAGFVALSGYQNRYRDFIQSLRSLGFDPASGLLIFQSQNIGRAEIRGAELRAGLALETLTRVLAGFELDSALSWQRGTDRTTDAPLASIDPLQLTLGLRRELPWASFELLGRFARGQDRLPDVPVQGPGGAVAAFAAPGHAVFDLFAAVPVGESARLRLGVFNVFDRRYWDSAALPLVAADADNMARFTQPGRSVSAGLQMRW